MFEQLFKMFEENGEELYLVGGFVRDHIFADMQDDPVIGGDGHSSKDALQNAIKSGEKDVDFATSAHPEKTIKIFKQHGLRAIPIGIEFGTVGTKVDGVKVEITTFRCAESYTKGSRKPAVVFGDTIESDLARRDFTINAIAMKQDGALIDPFGGAADIIQGIFGTPIEPEVSFSDDPLRMLRACRFQAREWNLEGSTGMAMTKLAHKIHEISKERVFEEISKLLMSKDPTKGLTLMVGTGLMNELFPEIQAVVDFKQNQGEWHSKAVWPHTLQVVRESPQILEIRWSALFHDVAKPQTYTETDTGIHFYQHDWKGALKWDEIARRLKVSNNFKRDVHTLIFEHLQPSLLARSVDAPTDKALRRLVRRLGTRTMLDNLFHLSAADITSSKPERVTEGRARTVRLKERIDALLDAEDIITLKLPKGTGTELMNALGLRRNKLGEVMKILTQRLVDGDITLGSNFVAEAAQIMKGLQK